MALSMSKVRKWPAILAKQLNAEYAFLFGASFLGECVLSVDTIVTAHGYWFAAGGTTLLYEVLTFVVLYAILDDNRRRSWPKFISAALGASAGAMVAVFFAT